MFFLEQHGGAADVDRLREKDRCAPARLPARRLSTRPATEVVSEGGQTSPRPGRAGWNRRPRAESLRERDIHAPCRRLRGPGEAFCPCECGFARFRRRAEEPDACRP